MSGPDASEPRLPRGLSVACDRVASMPPNLQLVCEATLSAALEAFHPRRACVYIVDSRHQFLQPVSSSPKDARRVSCPT
jgi:hypothetical protein